MEAALSSGFSPLYDGALSASQAGVEVNLLQFAAFQSPL